MSGVTGQANAKAAYYTDECAMFRKVDADILVDVSNGSNGYTLAAQSIDGAKELSRAMRAAGWTCTVRIWQTIASGNQPGYVEMPL